MCAFGIVWDWKWSLYESKHVARLRTWNLLSKYSCVFTDTYFIYYNIIQRNVTYQETSSTIYFNKLYGSCLMYFGNIYYHIFPT
jgi:hypothetical protein